MLCYRKNLLHRKNGGNYTDAKTRRSSRIVPLTVDEIEVAEKGIIRYVHEGSYRKELAVFRKGQQRQSPSEVNNETVQKTSSIYKLDPQLIDELLHVGGRLRNAPIPNEEKHQIIIPKESPVAKLLARH